MGAADYGSRLHDVVFGVTSCVDAERNYGTETASGPSCRNWQKLMDFSAAHISYVIASYVISGILMFGLLVYVLVRDRKLAAKLKDQKDIE